MQNRMIDEVVMNGVLNILKQKNHKWIGTMTQLNSTLVKAVGHKQSYQLPGSPGALRVVLNRIVNRLRSRKVSIKFARAKNHMRTRYVQFTR